MRSSAIVSSEDLVRIQAGSVRRETPCGEGVVVWHCWGPDDGRPVVLLHGGSGSWNHWVRNIDALVDAGLRVLAPDLPGCGESSLPPEGFDADVHAPWILKGLDVLAPGRDCDFVAFSFGCMVLAFLAAQAPQRVRRMLFVAPPSLVEARGPSPRVRPWRDIPAGPRRNSVHEHNLGVIMLRPSEPPPEVAVALHAANMERDRIPHRRLFKTDIIAQLLPSIHAPLWAVWGAEDALYRGSLESYSAVLARAPEFRTMTIIPRGAHWIQFEASDVFNELMLAILAR
jgi:pimeloyl-ACP methyl ester carboxylesterase